MERQKLRDLLARLHGELEDADAVDADTARMLRTVLDDIRRVLEGEARAEGPEESLVDRLRDAATDFEGSHPRLTAAVEEIANALAKAGI